jgi:hypothetical protein
MPVTAGCAVELLSPNIAGQRGAACSPIAQRSINDDQLTTIN